MQIAVNCNMSLFGEYELVNLDSDFCGEGEEIASSRCHMRFGSTNIRSVGLQGISEFS